MQVDVIPVKSILFGSQFKLVFLTGWAFWIAFGLLMLLLSVIAPSALTVNGQVADGIGDGFVAVVTAVLVGGVASALCSVIGCGVLGFVSKFISLGNISYSSDEV
jgi:hypothetical protein